MEPWNNWTIDIVDVSNSNSNSTKRIQGRFDGLMVKWLPEVLHNWGARSRGLYVFVELELELDINLPFSLPWSLTLETVKKRFALAVTLQNFRAEFPAQRTFPATSRIKTFLDRRNEFVRVLAP